MQKRIYYIALFSLLCLCGCFSSNDNIIDHAIRDKEHAKGNTIKSFTVIKRIDSAQFVTIFYEAKMADTSVKDSILFSKTGDNLLTVYQ